MNGHLTHLVINTSGNTSCSNLYHPVSASLIGKYDCHKTNSVGVNSCMQFLYAMNVYKLGAINVCHNSTCRTCVVKYVEFAEHTKSCNYPVYLPCYLSRHIICIFHFLHIVVLLVLNPVVHLKKINIP